jgi:hypothetical protein
MTTNPMFMKKLIVIITLFLPCLAAAQSRVSIDILGGFEVSNRHLSNTSEDEFAVEIFDKREREEGPKANYRTGLNVSIRISCGSKVDSGLPAWDIPAKPNIISSFRMNMIR